MSKAFTAALVQTNSGNDPAANGDMIVARIREAAAKGADFVLFPEVVTLVETGARNVAPKVTAFDADPNLPRFRDAARENGVWVLIGSMVVEHETMDRKFANRSVLISDTGEVVATYDKIHMFDVDLENGESYRESKSYEPGTRAVVADTPWGKLGLTVCYDLRFPHLYRRLAQAGAVMLAIPAAFTRPTGRAHWHVLMRARAIETGCFVLAPAQTGEHMDGRKTYGHSLIVDPWGEIVADGGEDTGIVLAEIDLDRVRAARAKVPSLTHDRPFEGADTQN
ncbi:MAG: amidohydrolase [Rhodospirillales bacterium CG15_BIG_FIL_POST_REV_8_21_14_020_66_15]|nr:MAG: amidohydrolase [Rhodospirillales bacterium CG15_BIG_FIL_POST_REV_8_21_14_020_66_15]